jgi:hypothetical protein
MVESGLGGQYWFSAMMAAKDARNATYKERIGTTPWMLMHGTKRDVSKFRAFGCRAYVYLNEERRERGKHVVRAIEAINLGFATDHNMSAYKFWIPSKQKLMLCNQAKFDELLFPYRKQEIINQDKEDHLTNILTYAPPGSKWIPYDKTTPSNLYEKVHYDRASDTLILRLTNEQDTYTKTTQLQFFRDILKVQTAFVASLVRNVEGLPPGIDPDRPPKNFKEAMARPDREQWAAAYQKEYQGFKDRNALAVVELPKGANFFVNYYTTGLQDQ